MSYRHRTLFQTSQTGLARARISWGVAAAADRLDNRSAQDRSGLLTGLIRVDGSGPPFCNKPVPSSGMTGSLSSPDSP